MTVPTQKSGSPRAWWRRPWVWIVTAFVVIVVVVVAVSIGVVMGANRPNKSASSPHALLTQMLNRADDAVRIAGGDWPGWTTDTTGYTGQPCTSLDAGSQQYSLTIRGSGIVDPHAAAARMTKHWESLGYTVRTVIPTDSTNNDLTQIAVDFPDGAGIGYAVSKVNSAIDAESGCSADPAMLDTTK
jgi:hypothetical protein